MCPSELARASGPSLACSPLTPIALHARYANDHSGRKSLLVRTHSNVDAQRLAMHWNRRVFRSHREREEGRDIQLGEGPRFVVDAEVFY